MILQDRVDEVPRAVVAHRVEERLPIPEIAGAFDPEVMSGFGGETDMEEAARQC